MKGFSYRPLSSSYAIKKKEKKKKETFDIFVCNVTFASESYKVNRNTKKLEHTNLYIANIM